MEAIDLYMSLVVSDCLSNATLTETLPPLPINPKTRMNISGNAKLNMMALGLLNIARKLARVIDSIARIWLYCLDMYDY
jgi:hypothetical protein